MLGVNMSQRFRPGWPPIVFPPRTKCFGPRRLLSLRGVLLFALLIALGACANVRSGPELALIYNEAARYHGPDRNPIVVIPGILGTKLVERGSERLVWGAFDGSAADPEDPDGARLIALPLRKDVQLAELRDEVEPDGVLERIRIRLLRIPLELQAYAQILSTLGVGGYRDEALGLSGEIDYGDRHFTCFQFDYDWRRDNVENAARLHAFLREKRAYVQKEYRRLFGIEPEEVKFDIAAHSMGGLLTRYFLRYGSQDLPEDESLPELTWEGARYVERVNPDRAAQRRLGGGAPAAAPGQADRPSSPHLPAGLVNVGVCNPSRFRSEDRLDTPREG
jgi:hypothetical protein